MAAYVVGRLQMRDPSWIEKYRATVPSIVAKHGGKYLVRGGKMETLEGKAPLPTSFVGGWKTLAGNRHVVAPEKTPLANVLLTFLDKIDIAHDKLGDSTGKLVEA